MHTLIARLSFVSLALFAVTPVQAGWFTGGSWSTSSDEGVYEVFAHGVEDYSGSGATNTTYCNDNAADFIAQMVAAGYSNYKYGTDANAWSSSWEEANLDDSYADAADFAFVSAHGSASASYVLFNGSSGDNKLYYSDTSWGDGDVEAVAIHSCQQLNAAGMKNYGSSNKNDGVHYIFGFATNAVDSDYVGYYYGYYMKNGYTLSSAWKTATRNTHTSAYTGGQLRFYNGSCNTGSDTAYSTSCDPKSSSSYASFTWTL